MKKRDKRIIIIAIGIFIFIIGYYLRAYLLIYKFMPGSPYEIVGADDNSLFRIYPYAQNYADKARRYPTSYLLNYILEPIIGKFYLIYIAGAIVIFFLGKEISGKNLGGFFAFLIYAVSNENLIQYTRMLNTSGLCYVSIWASLLFLLRYNKYKKNLSLGLFFLSTFFALTSYHTGATAMIVILMGILISLIYSSSTKDSKEILIRIDKKIIVSFLVILTFYLFWVKTFDPAQLELIIMAVRNSSNIKILTILLSGILFLCLLYTFGKLKILQSEWIPLMTIVPALILIFVKFGFFNFLLSLGVKNYYISTTTLNNYFAQIILTHIYLMALIPVLFKKNIKNEGIVLRGWLIGILIIFIGLAMKGFYARILDYSFPLAFILFGFYWCEHKRFRNAMVSLTIVLLILSQVIIYKDPFTMRRYYNQEEINSAQRIIDLNLKGKVASDFRTAALFTMLGKKDVKFSESGQETHDYIFYETEKLNNTNINYVILSESMKVIVYSADFETRPLEDDVFDYYKKNFKQIYYDKVMYVYKIR